MNKEIECETCIKRKTMYCPNSSECMSREDKPFYQNRIMLLEENEKLKEDLHQASIGIQELIEQDIECPTTCEKLKQENEKLNHYKLLYQKVKERNDKAIEYIDNCLDNEYQLEPDYAPNKYVVNILSKTWDILEGNNETD